jgi:light-regulated signal transduction histidine kinase (bacteriophytochrome)
VHRRPVDLEAMARELVAGLAEREPQRNVEFVVGGDLQVGADPVLVRQVLSNLLGNAWKFSGPTAAARIEFGVQPGPAGERVFFVRDNGAGFDMAFAGRLFEPFGRLHSLSQFEGNGIGLATVHKIVARHEGRIWAEAAPDAGATFYFTLGP